MYISNLFHTATNSTPKHLYILTSSIQINIEDKKKLKKKEEKSYSDVI